MSLKVTFEVDGQTEQQIAPVVAQWVARHPGWIGAGIQEPAPPQPQARDFHHDNAALLQQHIQQLTAQNKLLQQQVSYSQWLLAGAAKPKAMLTPATDSKRVVTDSAVAVSNGRNEQRAVPLLPAQYRTSKSTVVFRRLGRSLGRMPSRLWRSLIWLCFGSEWLLIFLLLSGGTYGILSIAPMLSNKLWPSPEFVESDNGPGDAAEPTDESTEAEAEENAPASAQPTSPTSKAGSHPAPPPAFQQP